MADTNPWAYQEHRLAVQVHTALCLDVHAGSDNVGVQAWASCSLTAVPEANATAAEAKWPYLFRDACGWTQGNQGIVLALLAMMCM